MALGEGPRRLARRTVTVGALAGLATLVTRVLHPEAPAVLGFDAPAPDGPVVSRAGVGPRPAGTSGLAAGGVAGGPAASPAVGSSPGAQGTGPGTTAELPRGGRALFPRYRLVGYCGGPGSSGFGRLGTGNLDQRVREVEALGAQYTAAAQPLGKSVVSQATPVREALPVLELIAVVVQRFPGEDGTYRLRVDPAVVEEYLAAARRHRALLLLNIQPGRSPVLDEVRAFEEWLREPDVGVALDPEWAVRAPLVPGQVFGHLTGAELDAVAGYLAGLVATHDLPEKAMVVHQLSRSVLRELDGLRARPGVVLVKSVDGIGSPEQKRATWRDLITDLPAGMRPGVKLFFAEDTAAGAALMTPAEVLALSPVPDYVVYE